MKVPSALTSDEVASIPTIALAVCVGETQAALDHAQATGVTNPEVLALLTNTAGVLAIEWARRFDHWMLPAEVPAAARTYCTDHPGELAEFDQVAAEFAAEKED